MRILKGAFASAIALAISQHALVAPDRTALPVSQPPFAGAIGRTAAESIPDQPFSVTAPQGAPNIIVFMSDDQGFAMSSVFGGPVPTPHFARLAERGQRYNRFHTTGICSPTRAALLTGRNHHRVGTGFLTDLSTGYPGYDGRFPRSAATIAETLRLNGYSTAMFGKHHNVPPAERTSAGPFDMWPIRLGFDYFYGFIGGDTDQWNPTLYRGTSFLPHSGDASQPLDYRLAEEAIGWVHNQKAAAPDKPFFIYYAPGSTHAPHQVPQAWIERFRGRFDHGWDQVREDIYKRQLAQGVIPAGTVLTSRPPEIPAWASLTPQQKAFAARSMEAAAAQLAYQDEQFGRVLDELGRMGELDNTLVVVIQGDNGASAEAGAAGTINEIGHMANGIVEDDAWLAANTDKLGGPETYASYPAGWAWAMATPLRWTKQYASMLGGIRNAMIMTWGDRAAYPGATCAEFGHVVDIAPSLLDAAGIVPPDTVNGVRQMPFDGKSLLPSMKSCEPDRPRTQYFEIAGKIGFYMDGWFLSSENGRVPWKFEPPATFDPVAPAWALYDLSADFSQSRDLAGGNPERLAAMRKAWEAVATDNRVFPLEHRFFRPRPANPLSGRKRYDYWGGDISVPVSDGPNLTGRSFTLRAKFTPQGEDASGALFAIGSWFGGWSLHLESGKPTFTYAFSTRSDDVVRISSTQPMSPDGDELELRFVSEGPGKAAEVQLRHKGATIASGRIPRTWSMAAPNAEMIDVGRDTGVPVTRYRKAGGRFDGQISHVSLTFDD